MQCYQWDWMATCKQTTGVLARFLGLTVLYHIFSLACQKARTMFSNNTPIRNRIDDGKNTKNDKKGAPAIVHCYAERRRRLKATQCKGAGSVPNPKISNEDAPCYSAENDNDFWMISKTTTYGIPRQKRQLLSGPIFNFNVLYQGKTTKCKSKVEQATCNHQRSDLRSTPPQAVLGGRIANGKGQQPFNTDSYEARQHRYRNLGSCLPILLLAAGLIVYGESPIPQISCWTEQNSISSSGRTVAEPPSRNHCASTYNDTHSTYYDYDHMELRRDHMELRIKWRNDYNYDYMELRRDHMEIRIKWSNDYDYDYMELRRDHMELRRDHMDHFGQRRI